MAADGSNASNNASDIAIVGMALRVPGARTVDEFWHNLRSGTESIRRLSEEELIAAGEGRDRLRHPNYVRATADLPDMEMFDAEFFGQSPKEAAIMDPQHRHFLECAWEALEDASKPPESVNGPVGVFAGCGMGSYFFFNVCSHRELVDSVGMFLLRHTGNDKDFLATRASYQFDLKGPSVNVQTACSTSLVAVHLACQSLLNGESDMALAGGVTIELPHRRGYIFQDGEILSPDGHCHAFDHRAAGTVFGSGVGVVVLRRLADAIADRDQIHAVIKATAVNNDGASKAGYLAPSVSGQSEAIVEAHGLASISADSIGYVECHGTGTYLGDPIEIEALSQAFRQSTNKTSFCRIGSVKTNIGHLDTAAGVVGLIKTALILKHGEIPASLGFEKPNPAINFAQTPFVVNSELTKWPSRGAPRRAAVNSLGVGGTNAHAILEEAPVEASVPERRETDSPHLLLLTARNRPALDQAANRLASYIEDHPQASLADISHTLVHGRKLFGKRRVVAARDRGEAVELLRASDSRLVFQHSALEGATKAAFLFPGGGSQYPNMARDLYERDGDFRATVDEGISYLPTVVADAVRECWFGNEPSARENFLRPSRQLPAILIVEIALARRWMRLGIRPHALIGHSMGENAAACIAGVMSYRDAVELVYVRGALFDSVSGGAMLSVPLPAEIISGRLPDNLDLAVINGPSLCVVSGERSVVAAFHEALAADGIDAQIVPIDIAAHSRMLDPLLHHFEKHLHGLKLSAPSIPIVSNLTGTWLTAEEATSPGYWTRHLRETVRFSAGISTLASDPSHVFLEVGPGKTLTSLVKAQGSVDANRVINSLRHADESCDDVSYFVANIGRAYALGLPVDLASVVDPRSRRISIPTYPFQHQRYFLDVVAPTTETAAETQLTKRSDIADWGYRPTWKAAPLESVEQSATHKWLIFLDDSGQGAELAERLRRNGHLVSTVEAGDRYARRSTDDYVLSPEHGRVGYDALLADLAAADRLPDRIAHLWLLTEQETFRPGSSFFHRNLERGFYSLFFLAQSLGDAAPSAPMRISIVTNGMESVKGEAVSYPEKATVLGPAKVIPKEFPHIAVRVIDADHQRSSAPWAGLFARSRPPTLVDHLLAEPHQNASFELHALRGQERFVQAYEPVRLELPSDVSKLPLRTNGAYLITGGTGDLALAISERLARGFQARLVLIGRGELPDRSTWRNPPKGNESLRRKMLALARLEDLGARVLYCQADVSNMEQMRAAVATARTEFGDINGVIHAAGVVKDDLIQVKSLTSIEDVFTAKVHGTTVLRELFKNEKLDLFALFSSVSTDTAPAGQVDYVAANSYLNAVAQGTPPGFKRPVSIHWGVWNEIGMAVRGVYRDEEAAAEHLRITRQPLFDRWIEDASGHRWLESSFGPSTHWLLGEHRTADGQAIWPGTGYLEIAAQALLESERQTPFQIDDIAFLRPLQVDDGDAATVRTSLERSGKSYDLSVKSAVFRDGRRGFQQHLQGKVTEIAPEPLARLDLEAVLRRCQRFRRQSEGSALISPQEKHLRFGPRWSVLQSVAMGENEAIARLQLPLPYRSDLSEGYVLHPALLDLATSFALELIPDFEADDTLWVPFSYKRIRIHQPLPSTIASWARLRRSDGGFASFDVSITNEAGEVIFEAEEFTVRCLPAASGIAIRKPTDKEVEFEASPRRKAKGDLSPAAARLAQQIEQGILPSEGSDAFLRALAAPGPQIIVSSMDLEVLRGMSAAPVAAASSSTSFDRPILDTDYVAPRDKVEETLVSFWQELLGVKKIGVTDNFFDLGGHSLIAVRLFSMVRKAFAVDFPISVLFEAPTIEACATLMRQATENAGGSATTSESVAHQTRFTHIVPMHPGEGSRKTPFFLCAGMFGNVLNLRHLAHLIGTDRPFYGLQARGLYGGQEPHESFEEMARDYLEELRAVQPHGPYLLGGFSGGGLVAYEMARQLATSNEHVNLLVMLDTPYPQVAVLSRRDKLSMKLQDIRSRGPGYAIEWGRNRIRWEMQRLRQRRSARTAVAPEQFHNQAIERAFRTALSCYAVKPYSGPVALFRPKLAPLYRLSGGRLLNNDRDYLFHDNGWSPYAAKLSIHEVPGDHDSMVLEPNVRVLAEKLRALIDSVEDNQSSLAIAAQ